MTLKDQVLYQVKELETEHYHEDQPTAYDWINKSLDIQYKKKKKKEYLGARILVTFGGPNIWVNTQYDQVEGYWGADQETWTYKDNLGIDEACRDLFECC